MELFLIRHAESIGNVDKSAHSIYADHALPLSENGELISEKLMPVFIRVKELEISKSEINKEIQNESWKTHKWFSENRMCYEWLEKQKDSQLVKLGWYQIFLLRKQI